MLETTLRLLEDRLWLALCLDVVDLTEDQHNIMLDNASLDVPYQPNHHRRTVLCLGPC